jgi:bifunctional non-homologous end joining protein LigD
MLARRDGDRVRLFTRNGYDWTDRFPLIRAGMAALKVNSCQIDGEAVCCERGRRSVICFAGDGTTGLFLDAFDLLEHDGADLRPLQSCGGDGRD